MAVGGGRGRVSSHWDQELRGRGGAEAGPGLYEGEVSRSRDTIAFLVFLKQFLQSLHVELVVVVSFLLGGVEALRHRDGAAHCRERGDG